VLLFHWHELSAPDLIHLKKKWNTQHVYPLGTDLSVKGAESQLKKRRNLHNEVKYTLIHLNTLLFKPAAYVQMWNAGKHNQSRSVSSCTGRSEDGWICRSSAVSPLAALLCDPLDIRRRDMTILTCLSPSSFCVDPAPRGWTSTSNVYRHVSECLLFRWIIHKRHKVAERLQ
jgi:hypothetical protein